MLRILGAGLSALVLSVLSPALIFSQDHPQKDKVYSVKEVVELIKSDPASLKGKSIQLEAYVVDAVQGFNCEDFWILADKEYVQAFNDRYNWKLSKEQCQKALEESQRAPVLQTGRSLALSKKYYSTTHAIYRGHFYDKWAAKNCAEGWKRFVIDEKVKEIISGGS